MSTDNVVRDVALLAPKVHVAAASSLLECTERGYLVRAFETWRSPSRQADLYAQGRTKPGKIVTNAKPFTSGHQHGIALDIAYFINGRWSWEGDFDKPVSIFMQHGFDRPPSFEKAHLQMSMGYSIEKIRDVAQKETLIGLWRFLGLD